MVGRFFEEFEVGEELVTPSRTVTEADIVMFSGLSGDYSPHHTDDEFIKTLPFEGKIAHGPLVIAVSSGLIVSLNLWRDTAIALMEINVKFKGATVMGDTIKVVVKVSDKKETKKGDKGTNYHYKRFFPTQEHESGNEVIRDGKPILDISKERFLFYEKWVSSILE